MESKGNGVPGAQWELAERGFTLVSLYSFGQIGISQHWHYYHFELDNYFCRIFSNISGLYLLMLVPPPPTVMTTKDVSRYYQMSYEGKSAPDDNL